MRVYTIWFTGSEIEHRLTKPATPKTNGMVERINGTIKNATVKAMTYQNIGSC